MDTDRIKISLLGPPDVTFKQSHVIIKRKILRKLLYYLACQKQPVSRAAICDLFWPEDTEEEARKNLREAISRLKSELPLQDVILARYDLIELDSQKISVDYLEFEEVVAVLRRNLDLIGKGRMPETMAADIRHVLTLWRTFEFMDGGNLPESAPFQNWVVQTRENLRYWRQMMLEWMADHCITNGNLSEALFWLSTALLNDRLNVELNYLTLNCLKDLGLRSAALHFCDLLDSLYKEEGKSLLPLELKNLVFNVRKDAKFVSVKKSIQWDLYERKEVEFLAYEDLVQKLTQFIYRGGVFLLRGEPSSGKTRILKEFYDNLEIAPKTIYCRARPEENHIPYQPLVDGFRSIVVEEEWNALDLIYAQALYPLFPELAKIRKDVLPEELNRSLELGRLIPEAIHALYKILIGKKRGLLLVEDAQWCDEYTLRVLSYIVEHELGKINGTAILAARTDIENPHLNYLFLKKTRMKHYEVLTIRPLSESQIKEVCHSTLGYRPDIEIVQWLRSGSGGNIGYLLEIINDLKLSQQNISELAEVNSWPINSFLSSLLDNRIETVDGYTKELLSIMAILDNEIAPKTLNSLSVATLTQINQSLMDLQRKQIISEWSSEQGEDQYYFTHGVFKQRILDKMDINTRKALEIRIEITRKTCQQYVNDKDVYK